MGGYRKFQSSVLLYFHLNLSSFLATFSDGRIVWKFSPRILSSGIFWQKSPHKIRLYIYLRLRLKNSGELTISHCVFLFFSNWSVHPAGLFSKKILPFSRFSGCKMFRGRILRRSHLSLFPPFLSSPPSNKNKKSWIYPLPTKSGLNNPLFFSGFYGDLKNVKPVILVVTQRGEKPSWGGDFFWPFLSRSCWTYPQVQAGGECDPCEKKGRGIYTLNKNERLEISTKMEVDGLVLKMSFRISKRVMFRVPVVSLRGSNLFWYPVCCIHVWNFPRTNDVVCEW